MSIWHWLWMASIAWSGFTVGRAWERYHPTKDEPDTQAYDARAHEGRYP